MNYFEEGVLSRLAITPEEQIASVEIGLEDYRCGRFATQEEMLNKHPEWL